MSSIALYMMAQTCNDDVLLDIMGRLAGAHLASAALVCRRWRPTAQTRLYRCISLDTNSVSSHQLSSTLSADAGLRSLVRDLVIFHRAGSNSDKVLLRWLELLPEGSLLSLRIEQMFIPKPDDLSLLRYPSVRSVPSVSVWPAANFLSVERLDAVLQLPSLENLSLRILPYLLPRQLTVTCIPKLRRLSIETTEYFHTITEILGALDPASFVRFDLITNALSCAAVETLCHDLQPLLPRLKHFSMHPRQSKPDEPFVDDLILVMPSLQTLACGWGACSAKVLGRLPPAFLSLTLLASAQASFPDAQFAEALKIAQVPTGMKMLTIVDTGFQWSSACCAERESLANTCASRGLVFEVVDKGGCGPLFFGISE